MTDANKEYEGRNVQSPRNIIAHSCNSQSISELVDVTIKPPAHHDEQTPYPDLSGASPFLCRAKAIFANGFYFLIQIINFDCHSFQISYLQVTSALFPYPSLNVYF